MQHAPEWSGWLKRIADRADPYVFVATGSSATALRRGGQDAGVGRWRELTLFPWSFREHVELRALPSWTFAYIDALAAGDGDGATRTALGPIPSDEDDRLEGALADYLLRGGFPEAAVADDDAEARRRLRQDILDRSLGRDISDVAGVDARTLERMFLRICRAPGGLWNETEVANDLGITRPTVRRYMTLLEQAFLVFRLPNLASPIKGRPKVYLVAPALRQALLGYDGTRIREPDEWGRVVECAVAAALVGSRPDATQIGFWQKDPHECDFVVVRDPRSEYIEVKRGGKSGVTGVLSAARKLRLAGTAALLGHRRQPAVRVEEPLVDGGAIARLDAALWLYVQTASDGGTLRIRA